MLRLKKMVVNMVEFRHNHSEQATRSMLKALAGLAVFALVFIGIIVGLGYIAPQSSSSSSAPPPASSEAAQPPSKTDGYTADELNVPVKPFHILLIGSDSRKGTALYTGKSNEHAQIDQHADVITLVRVDPREYTVTLVTIPRDTVLEEDGAKINDALLTDDPTKVVDAVEQLTGVRSEFYMMISFTAFEELIDAFGGITVDVPRKITVLDPATGDSITVKAGKKQKLNGAKALVLARARKEYGSDQDALRQVNVRAIEKALIGKLLTSSKEVDVVKAVDAVLAGVKTNMSLPQSISLLREFARHADQVTVYECTGPYDGDNRASDGLWVVGQNPEAWEEIMALVEAGEDPSQVVPAPTF